MGKTIIFISLKCLYYILVYIFLKVLFKRAVYHLFFRFAYSAFVIAYNFNHCFIKC